MKVNRSDVTVAEAVIINVKHGGSAVNHIANIRAVEVSPMRLKADLQERYLSRAGDDGDRDIADKLFPGMSPQFPATFAEAGFEVSENAYAADDVDAAQEAQGPAKDAPGTIESGKGDPRLDKPAGGRKAVDPDAVLAAATGKEK
jgi:hypothetical protein